MKEASRALSHRSADVPCRSRKNVDCPCKAAEVPTVHAKAAKAPTVHGEATKEPTIGEVLWQILKEARAGGMIRCLVIKELLGKKFMRSEVINLIGESLDMKLALGGHGKFKRSRKLKKAYRIWLESSVSSEAAESQRKNMRIISLQQWRIISLPLTLRKMIFGLESSKS
ncbi:hypothetical protein GOBAR_DD36021 [Gossypium barbadense]|nr:hypothetical protein GOBAR_DD36021 [Gossypium barbadense]